MKFTIPGRCDLKQAAISGISDRIRPAGGKNPVIHLSCKPIGRLHHIRQNVVLDSQSPIVFCRDSPGQGIRRRGECRILCHIAVDIGFAGQGLGDAGLDAATGHCDLRSQPLGIRGTAGEACGLRLTVVPHFTAAVVGGILVAVFYHNFAVVIHLHTAAVIVIVGHGDGIQGSVVCIGRLVGPADVGKLYGFARRQVAHSPGLVIPNIYTGSATVTFTEMERNILNPIHRASGRADGRIFIACRIFICPVY